MKNVTLEIIRDTEGFQDDLVVRCDGKEIGRGSFGGEPEDNSIGRTYRWVPKIIGTLAIALGAEVSPIVTRDRTEEDD